MPKCTQEGSFIVSLSILIACVFSALQFHQIHLSSVPFWLLPLGLLLCSHMSTHTNHFAVDLQRTDEMYAHMQVCPCIHSPYQAFVSNAGKDSGRTRHSALWSLTIPGPSVKTPVSLFVKDFMHPSSGIVWLVCSLQGGNGSGPSCYAQLPRFFLVFFFFSYTVLKLMY